MSVGAREVIGASGLGQVFGDSVALCDVSFSVSGPGLVGVLGPNGAGKTSLLDILEGLSEPSSGSYRLFGEEMSPSHAKRGYPRAKVGVVMQREARLERIQVGEYAELFAAIQKVPGGNRRIVEQAKLGGRERQAVSKLSGGEAARLFIAAALVHDPELVLMDEPTAALDPESKQEVGDLLLELSRERTLLVTTHDLREADRLCQDLIFLVAGKVQASGSREQLVQSVPARKRRGLGVEDAFFHYCSLTLRGGVAIEARTSEARARGAEEAGE